MTRPPPNLVPSITAAAELRAAGQSWEQVGKQVGRSADAARKWAVRYPAFWAEQLAAARADLRAGAADESVAVLRTLLRSDDEKVRRDAARDLITRTPPPADDPPRRSDLHRLADYLEGLTDDELRTLLGDDVPDHAPRPGRPVGVPDAPAGAA